MVKKVKFVELLSCAAFLAAIAIPCAVLLLEESSAMAYTCSQCTLSDETNCAAYGPGIQWCGPPGDDIETQAVSGGSFSAYTEVKWCDSSIGTIGAFEVVEDSEENIEDVDYYPAYFFPAKHCEVKGVTITGTLIDDDYDGYVNNLVWKTFPYRSHEKGLTVFKP